MKWDLEATVIGEFTKGNEVVIRDKNHVLSKTPIIFSGFFSQTGILVKLLALILSIIFLTLRSILIE